MEYFQSLQATEQVTLIVAIIGAITPIIVAVINILSKRKKKENSSKREDTITINQHGAENATIIGIQNNYSGGDKHAE